MSRTASRAPVVVEPPFRSLEVKPIFATPPTHVAKNGETKTFTITLETKIPEAGGDDYDITIPLNPKLVASCPSTVHVKQGETSFDLTVQAAATGTGKAQIEIRERSDKGVISVSLLVQN